MCHGIIRCIYVNKNWKISLWPKLKERLEHCVSGWAWGETNSKKSFMFCILLQFSFFHFVIALYNHALECHDVGMIPDGRRTRMCQMEGRCQMEVIKSEIEKLNWLRPLQDDWIRYDLQCWCCSVGFAVAIFAIPSLCYCHSFPLYSLLIQMRAFSLRKL